MIIDTKTALGILRSYRGTLSRQELRTIRGQIIKGDIHGALRGLKRKEAERHDAHDCHGQQR